MELVTEIVVPTVGTVCILLTAIFLMFLLKSRLWGCEFCTCQSFLSFLNTFFPSSSVASGVMEYLLYSKLKTKLCNYTVLLTAKLWEESACLFAKCITGCSTAKQYIKLSIVNLKICCLSWGEGWILESHVSIDILDNYLYKYWKWIYANAQWKCDE